MYQGTPFQNLGRDDNVDTTVQNLDNQRYANYILSNFSLGVPQSQHVDFATSQPSIMYTGLAQGEGLNGDVVDFDSTLNIQKQQ